MNIKDDEISSTIWHASLHILMFLYLEIDWSYQLEYVINWSVVNDTLNDYWKYVSNSLDSTDLA